MKVDGTGLFKRVRGRIAFGLTLGVMVCLCPTWIWGQLPTSQKVPERTATTWTTTFDEDLPASEVLARGIAYQRNGDFAEAFKQYLWVLERQGDRLARVDANRVVNAWEFCLEQVRGLPVEVLAGYRMALDGEAGRELESARRSLNVLELEALSHKFILTTFGEEILDLLGEVYRERGEAARAGMAWRRLRESCPQGRLDRKVILAKEVAAWADAGAIEEARRGMEEWARRYPGGKLTVAGREVDWKDFLGGSLKQASLTVTTRPTADARTWPQFGGNVHRDGLVPGEFHQDAWVWSIELPGVKQMSPEAREWSVLTHDEMRRLAAVGVVDIQAGVAPAQVSRRMLGTYSDGRYYLSDGWGVMCMDALTERMLWMTPGYWNPETNPRSGRPVSRMARQVVVWEGVVYATLTNRLTGLDARTGKTLWLLPGPGGTEDTEWLTGAAEVSDPLVMSERLYVSVKDIPEEGITRYRLVCLDLATRQVQWKRFLCESRTSRLTGVTWPGVKVPATDGGLVFVNTEVGGLAAVEADTGRMRWGYAYERRAPAPVTEEQERVPSEVLRFEPTWNPGPVVVDQVLCSAPVDSEMIYGIEARTGRTLWKVLRDGVQTIIGVADGTLVLSGREVWWLDVKTGDVRKWKSEPLEWCGQGSLTPRSVYVPTPGAIYRFDRVSGKLAEKVLLDPENEEAGNLLLVDGRFVSVSTDSLHVFREFQKVVHDLSQEARSVQADPRPLERLGMIYRRRGEWKASLENYLGAYQRMGRSPTTFDREAGSRVTRALFEVYERRVQEELTAGRPGPALDLANARLTVAWDGASRVQARLGVIECLRRLGRWTEMVAVLQEMILREPDTLYPFGEGGSVSARIYARQQIAELIARHGQKVYETWDGEAQKLLRSGNLEQVGRVVSEYANSVHLRDARVALSRMLASQGRFRDAAEQLNRLLLTDLVTDRQERATMTFLLGNYLEQDGQLVPARKWYEELRDRYGEHRLTEGGRMVTAGQWVSERLGTPLFRNVPTDDESLPRLGRGLIKRWEVSAGQGWSMETTDNTPDARLILRGPQGDLKLVDPRTGEVPWEETLSGPVRRTYCQGERLATLVGENEVTLLNLSNGKEIWRVPVKGVSDLLVFDGQDVAALAREEGNPEPDLTLLNGSDGSARWKHRVMGRYVVRVTMHDGRVTLLTTNPAKVTMVSAETGEELEGVGGVLTGNIFRTMDGMRSGRVVLATVRGPQRRLADAKLVCLDLKTGSVVWSQENLVGAEDATLGVMAAGGEPERVYVCLGKDTVMCLDAQTGGLVWTQKVPGQRSLVAISAGEDGCYVAGSQQEGPLPTVEVWRLNAADGKVEWTTKLGTGSWRSITTCRDAVVVTTVLLETDALGRAQPVVARVSLLDTTTGEVTQEIRPGGSASNAWRLWVAVMDSRLWLLSGDGKVTGYSPQ